MKTTPLPRLFLVLLLLDTSTGTRLMGAQTPSPAAQPVFPNFAPSSPCLQVVLADQILISGNDGMPIADDPYHTTLGTNALAGALSNAAASITAYPTTCMTAAVEVVSNGNLHGIITGPLTIPANVSLIVDGGVIIFGSSNPSDYQDPNAVIDGQQVYCGTVNPKGQGMGCLPLLTFSGSRSGLYGYGIVDGRGYVTMQPTTFTTNSKVTVGPGGNYPLPSSSQSWWYQTDYKGGINQSLPTMISASANNFTLYKITLRNSPFWNVNWGPPGATALQDFVAWGVKVQDPWDVVNTDGIDVSGKSVTIDQVTVANGDDGIEVNAGGAPADGIYIGNITSYSRNGISLGSSLEKGVSNVLVQYVNMTDDVISLNTTTGSVNGMTFANMMAQGSTITSYVQALPASWGITRGLNIKHRPDRGGGVIGATFQNACLRDMNYPITLAPFEENLSQTAYPEIYGITYDNIHILAPTDSMGVAPYRTGYQLRFEGYPVSTDTSQGMYNIFTLDNVVIDSVAPNTSLMDIEAVGNDITTADYVPTELNRLGSSTFTPYYKGAPQQSWLLDNGTDNTPSSTDQIVVSPYTDLMLNMTRYHEQSNSTTPPTLTCTDPQFTSGEFFLSIPPTSGTASPTGNTTNLSGTVSITNGEQLSLNAIVQPAISQITHFSPNDALTVAGVHYTGLLAVAAPATTAPVSFYLDGSLSSFATANPSAFTGLASVNYTFNSLASGPHTITAAYAGDTYYTGFTIGSITIDIP